MDGAGTGTPTIGLELPEGGQFRDLAISPVDDTWYALSYFGGLFRSDDQGASWSACGVFRANAVEVAANGDVFGSGATVVRSTDRCATFVDVVAPTASLDIGVAGTTTYALGDNQLWRFDGPGTWTQVPTQLDTNLYRAFDASPTLRIVGSEGAGIAVSTDGTAWTQKTTGLRTLLVVDVAVGPTRSYVLTGADANANGGVSCSDGTGNVWTVCDLSGGTAITVDPLDDQHVVFAPYDSLAETTNAFGDVTTGLRAAGGMDDAIVRDLRYTASGTLVVASDRGVFAAPSRPLQFAPRFSGLSAWTIDAIARNGDDVFIGTEAGVLRSTRGGPFTLSTTGLRFNTQIWKVAVAPDGTLIGPGRFIWRSRDRAATWQIGTTLGDTDGFYAHVAHFVGDRVWVGTKTRLWFADPPYETWTPQTVPGVSDVYGLAHAGSTLFVASAQGISTSSDGGMSFTSSVAAACVDIVTLASGRAVAACDDGVYIADAPYALWTQRLPGQNLHDLTSIGDGRVVVLGLDAGAHVSSDDGETWTSIDTPADVSLQSAIYDPGDGSLVLGTYGHGLVRVALP